MQETLIQQPPLYEPNIACIMGGKRYLLGHACISVAGLYMLSAHMIRCNAHGTKIHCQSMAAGGRSSVLKSPTRRPFSSVVYGTTASCERTCTSFPEQNLFASSAGCVANMCMCMGMKMRTHKPASNLSPSSDNIGRWLYLITHPLQL